MSEVSVETKVCEICGADIRPNSQFCYNCGGTIVEATEPEVEIKATLVEEAKADTSVNGNLSQSITALNKRSHERSERLRLRTIERKPVEIVWEKRSGVSIPFVVATTLILFISLLLILATFYIK